MDIESGCVRDEAGYSPPARASLDYCYVRPQHIAPVNALLAQFFWPGIDSLYTLNTKYYILNNTLLYMHHHHQLTIPPN